MTSAGILFSDASISSPTINSVRIHPLVVFQMADSFERAQPKRASEDKKGGWSDVRADSSDNKDGNDSSSSDNLYSVGVLYGNIVDHTAVVLDSIACVPRDDTVIDKSIFSRMNSRHREMFPKEEVIGYYTFGTKNIEWSSIVPVDESSVHIWVTPLNPPKIDAFCVSHSHKDKLIFLPIEYTIDASVEEQMGLSRLADQTVANEDGRDGDGSLQAGVRELRSLIGSVGDFCRSEGDTCMKDNIVGRQIYVAIQQACMSDVSRSVLEENIRAIEKFVSGLSSSDNVVGSAEDQLCLPLE